jgi:hypothetical protein
VAALALPSARVRLCCLGLLAVYPIPAAPVAESGCCVLTVWPCDRGLLGGPGLPGICPVPGPHVFLHDGVGARSQAANMIQNELFYRLQR